MVRETTVVALVGTLKGLHESVEEMGVQSGVRFASNIWVCQLLAPKISGALGGITYVV